MSKTSIGHIVNLLANDALQLKESFHFLHMVWIAPLLVTVLTVLLWQQVGAACFAGLGVQVFLLLEQGFIAGLLIKYR